MKHYPSHWSLAISFNFCYTMLDLIILVSFIAFIDFRNEDLLEQIVLEFVKPKNNNELYISWLIERPWWVTTTLFSMGVSRLPMSGPVKTDSSRKRVKCEHHISLCPTFSCIQGELTALLSPHSQREGLQTLMLGAHHIYMTCPSPLSLTGTEVRRALLLHLS